MLSELPSLRRDSDAAPSLVFSALDEPVSQAASISIAMPTTAVRLTNIIHPPGIPLMRNYKVCAAQESKLNHRIHRSSTMKVGSIFESVRVQTRQRSNLIFL
jgi:hypothetical protein